MRLQHLALVAALSLSVPVALSAQTTSSTSGTDRTTTTSNIDQTSGTTSTQTTATTTTTTNTSVNPTYSDHPNRWIASAFVGSNFSNNSGSMFGGVNSPTAVSTSTGATGTVSSSGSSVDYGAQLGYLWGGKAGLEFLAGFTPNFKLENTLIASGTTPNVNTYMMNAIGAVPIGSGGTIQPFISGGLGAITMRGLSASTTAAGSTTVTTTGTSSVSSDLFSPNESHAGGDIGGGIMAFMGGWGVRGDIRYFRAFGSTTGSSSTTATGTTTAGATTTGATTTTSTVNLLPGLNFWRANIGLAFRW